MSGMTLTDFLLARIAEDEAAIGEMGWDPLDEWWLPAWVTRDRLLAQCARDRRIVDVARYAPEGSSGWGFRRILRDLASVYADHPDYREEWRP